MHNINIVKKKKPRRLHQHHKFQLAVVVGQRLRVAGQALWSTQRRLMLLTQQPQLIKTR
jgi:hypothetical protein